MNIDLVVCQLLFSIPQADILIGKYLLVTNGVVPSVPQVMGEEQVQTSCLNCFSSTFVLTFCESCFLSKNN